MTIISPGDMVQFRPKKELETIITKWFQEPNMHISQNVEENYRKEVYSYEGKLYTIKSIEHFGENHSNVSLKGFPSTCVILPEFLKPYEVDDSIPDMFGGIANG